MQLKRQVEQQQILLHQQLLFQQFLKLHLLLKLHPHPFELGEREGEVQPLWV